VTGSTGVRILFVAPHLGVGGAQRLWSFQLPGLRDRGFAVGLLTLEAEGEFFGPLRAQGIAARCVNMSRRSDVRGWGRALRVSASRPDIVLTNDVAGDVVGHVLARAAGSAHVSVDHRGPELELPHYREGLTRMVAARLDRLITSTPRKLEQLQRRGVPVDRIRIIPNGIPHHSLCPSRSRAQTRAELGLEPSHFAAVLISVLRPEKRPAAFAAAVGRAHRRDPRLRGLVAGDGPERGAVDAAAAATGGAVTVLGHRDDIPDLILAADVVCLTSAAEASPIAVLEAMALGRPVVAPRVGGVAEIVVDGTTGILFAPGDDDALTQALLDLAASPDRADGMGSAGQRCQRAEFGADRMHDAYARELTRVVAERAQ
jgi:glycosyltransferase involved in cell wall biosynthesis